MHPTLLLFFFSIEFALAMGLTVLDRRSINLCFLTLFTSTLPKLNSATGFTVLDVRSLLAEVLHVKVAQVFLEIIFGRRRGRR